MRDVEIQPADPDAARAIAEIHARSFRTAYEHLPLTRRSAESGHDTRVMIWADRLARSDRTTLIAVEDGHVVGFVHLGPSPDDDADDQTGHIFSLHVDPDLTGMGVGGRLIEAAVAALATQGFRTATLWAVGHNEQVQGFYHRLGWRGDSATRIEKLAVGDDEGDEVEVVRLCLELDGMAEGASDLDVP